MHHSELSLNTREKGSRLNCWRVTQVCEGKGLPVKLEVTQAHEPAVRLYKKAGFEYLGDYDVYIIRDIQSIEL
jgi:hypothetical protein